MNRSLNNRRRPEQPGNRNLRELGRAGFGVWTHLGCHDDSSVVRNLSETL